MWDADVPSAKNYRYAKLLKGALVATLVILITGYLASQCVLRYSSTVNSDLASINVANRRFNADLYNPAKYGLIGARNLYLTTPDGASLGIWHTLPSALQPEAASLDTDDPYDATVISRYSEWLQNATVFVYFHGSDGSRASRHRINLYKLLNSLGYHVVTFDYRGFGDSMGQTTSEQDVAMDASTVLNWLEGHVKSGHIFLWGHSFGSGVVSSQLAQIESEPNKPVVGAVLESSCNNILDALRTYPMAMPYARRPGFDSFADDPITSPGLSFRSEEYLKRVSVPLLFLHAEDDHVVPYKLGLKLYQAAISSRQDPSTVTFVGYSKTHGYGHMNIGNDPNLGDIVSDFVENSMRGETYSLHK